MGEAGVGGGEGGVSPARRDFDDSRGALASEDKEDGFVVRDAARSAECVACAGF
jgi:hypothetical protein